MDIENRIQEIRKSYDRTARELSKRVEVSPSFISAEENVVEAKISSIITTFPEEQKWQLLIFF